ncbi:MAG: hypothetical protein GXP55_17485 [Deltaproteobacteria bacterium]|nr:hypothetical protein [Deltaproteobacteria bacterium]
MNSANGVSQGRVAKAHHLFRGAAEVTKRLRQLALALELAAAVIAAWSGLSGAVLWGGWASLVMLLLMFLAMSLRAWSRSTHNYSERCRRLSITAFAYGDEIGAAVLSGLVVDAPPFAESFAARLPAKTLDEYYEPTAAAGRWRLQELYAHSSFYSWRLLNRAGWLFLSVGVLVALGGVIVIYGMALPSADSSMAGRFLDFVCSLVFVVLAFKAFDAAADAFVASRGARGVADVLVATRDSDRAEEQAAHYDMERVSGPTVPTRIYEMSRKRLQQEWHERRRALDEIEQSTGTRGSRI